MASLSNDLESLSLNLPDVVVEAAATAAVGSGNKPLEAAAASASRRRGRRNGGSRRKTKPSRAAEVVEAEAEDAASLGACALDDQRVPDLSAEVYLPGADEPPPEEGAVALGGFKAGGFEVAKRAGGRSKRNRRNKRKQSSNHNVGVEVPEVTETRKNHPNVGPNQDFPFDNDSDNDEEPKYIWRNVTKSGCIKKCLLVDGKIELGRPKPGDTVLVKIQGKLKDGTIVDDYPTMVFTVGEYEVIDGLDLAVQSMYKNELSIVSIKPELAYGDQGRGQRAPCGRMEESCIPANARITYLFGLLHFEKAKDIGAMTWAQRRKSGQSRLRLANWWYQRKEYPIAVKCYKKALECYNDIQTNRECSSAEEYKELLQLMEERLRVMRQVANIFKRIANLIQSGEISV